MSIERDDGGVIGCSDGNIAVVGHERALGVIHWLIADVESEAIEVDIVADV